MPESGLSGHPAKMLRVVILPSTGSNPVCPVRRIKLKPMTLPEIEKIDITNCHVDGTPDGKYALRILKAFRAQCNTKWVVSGLPEERTLLWKTMNEHQDQRAAELDKAIEILERNTSI